MDLIVSVVIVSTTIIGVVIPLFYTNLRLKNKTTYCPFPKRDTQAFNAEYLQRVDCIHGGIE